MADETQQGPDAQPAAVLGTNQTAQQQIAAAVLAAEEEARRLGLDTTVPGGAYQVNGQWVDANGMPIKAPRGK